MVNDNLLPVNTYGHLLRDIFEPTHESFLGILDVVITQNQEYSPIQPVHHGAPLRRTAECKVAQVKDSTVFRDGIIPISYQRLIHFLHRTEWPVAELDYVLMAEMRIRGKEQILSREPVLKYAYIVIRDHHIGLLPA